MSLDLNELRAQREKMREHLDWLDRQIAELEGKPAPAQAISNKPAEPVLGAPAATTAPKGPEPEPATPEPAEAVGSPAPQAAIPADYKPGGFDGSSKLGCVLAAIVLAGLIIFLLFGLPELLYPDAPQ